MNKDKALDKAPEINFPITKNKRTKIKAFFQRTAPYFRIFNIAMMLLILSTVFLFPYPDPFQAITPSDNTNTEGLESKTVLIPRSQHQTIFDNFNQSVEEGFCLFGEVNKTHIKVEEISFVETPLMQTKTRIHNLCIDEIKNNLPKAYIDYDYKLIGNIHTHPGGRPELSKLDIHSMGKMFLFQRVWGVANKDTVNFYTHDSLGMGLPVEYY